MRFSPAPQQTQNNYHIHLIFSERELLPEPIEKIATRNMFYNEQGKYVRTKKEILDDNGNVRKGRKIIKKGETYERTLFTAKNKLFKQEYYLDEAKRFYTDLINLLMEDDKNKLHVFDRNGLYLATKKIGKNNPKAEQIKADNEVRMLWNHEVNRAIVSEVPEDKIRQIKKEYIKDRIRQSIDAWGRQHGFATVQDFYTAFYTAQRATDAYQRECAKWKEAYEENSTPKAETMHEKIQRYQEKADRQNASQPYRSRDKGAR